MISPVARTAGRSEHLIAVIRIFLSLINPDCAGVSLLTLHYDVGSLLIIQ